MKLRRACVVVCSWRRSTNLAVKWSSCSWSSMPTRSTYSTGLWIAATQAPTSSPQAASKPSLQSVAAGTKPQQSPCHLLSRWRSAAGEHVFLKSTVLLSSLFLFVESYSYSLDQADFLSEWGNHLDSEASPQLILLSTQHWFLNTETLLHSYFLPSLLPY